MRRSVVFCVRAWTQSANGSSEVLQRFHQPPYFGNVVRLCSSNGPAFGRSVLRNDPVVVSHENNAVGLDILLPSKDERCLFTLKPFSNTVGDLYSVISKEDGGVERVSVYREDGLKISKSTAIAHLLRNQFRLVINEHQFKSQIPQDLEHFQEESEYEKLKEHVYEVSKALEVVEDRLAAENKLRNDIKLLKDQLAPMVEAQESLVAEAHKKCNRMSWAGLSLMGVQFGFLARLTWYEYSWDIMEPVTYFVTYGTASAMFAYYVLTKQEYNFADVRNRMFWINMHKHYDTAKFDLPKFERLLKELEEKEQAAEKFLKH